MYNRLTFLSIELLCQHAGKGRVLINFVMENTAVPRISPKRRTHNLATLEAQEVHQKIRDWIAISANRKSEHLEKTTDLMLIL